MKPWRRRTAVLLVVVLASIVVAFLAIRGGRLRGFVAGIATSDTLQGAIHRMHEERQRTGGRASAFYAVTMRLHDKRTSIDEAEVIRVLGKPDLEGIDADTRTRLLIYFYNERGREWFACATLTDGKLQYFSYNRRAALYELEYWLQAIRRAEKSSSHEVTTPKAR